jgi:hypothetical protein
MVTVVKKVVDNKARVDKIVITKNTLVSKVVINQ